MLYIKYIAKLITMLLHFRKEFPLLLHTVRIGLITLKKQSLSGKDGFGWS